MAKERRATDKLNVALSTISAAATVGSHFVDELPDGGSKRALTTMIEQIEKGLTDARTQLGIIKKAAESI